MIDDWPSFLGHITGRIVVWITFYVFAYFVFQEIHADLMLLNDSLTRIADALERAAR